MDEYKMCSFALAHFVWCLRRSINYSFVFNLNIILGFHFLKTTFERDSSQSTKANQHYR